MENHLVRYNSNHSRCTISIFIITIKLHQLMIRCRCSVKFSLSRRDGDSNLFQPAGELFLTQTQTYLRQGSLRSPLVQLRYNRGSEQCHTFRDTTGLLGSSGLACPWTHTTALRTSLLHLVCVVSLIGSWPELSYSASRSERLI